MRGLLERVRAELGLDIYSFSVFHVFFEQYLSVGRDAAALLAAAVAAVSACVLAFTGSLWACALTGLVLTIILVRAARGPAERLLLLRCCTQELSAHKRAMPLCHSGLPGWTGSSPSGSILASATFPCLPCQWPADHDRS